MQFLEKNFFFLVIMVENGPLEASLDNLLR